MPGVCGNTNYGGGDTGRCTPSVRRRGWFGRFRKRGSNVAEFERERRGVGEGWQPIIEKLDKDLIDLLGDYDLWQIKEKFGGLRYYISAPPGCDVKKVAQIRDLIDAAEEASFHTCEVCGQPGSMDQTGGWMKTLCPVHIAKRQVERAERGF